jgi:hypothetical protein
MPSITRGKFMRYAMAGFATAVEAPFLAAQETIGNRAALPPREKLRITRLELFKVKPR